MGTSCLAWFCGTSSWSDDGSRVGWQPDKFVEIRPTFSPTQPAMPSSSSHHRMPDYMDHGHRGGVPDSRNRSHDFAQEPRLYKFDRDTVAERSRNPNTPHHVVNSVSMSQPGVPPGISGSRFLEQIEARHEDGDPSPSPLLATGGQGIASNGAYTAQLCGGTAKGGVSQLPYTVEFAAKHGTAAPMLSDIDSRGVRAWTAPISQYPPVIEESHSTAAPSPTGPVNLLVTSTHQEITKAWHETPLKHASTRQYLNGGAHRIRPLPTPNAPEQHPVPRPLPPIPSESSEPCNPGSHYPASRRQIRPLPIPPANPANATVSKLHTIRPQHT